MSGWVNKGGVQVYEGAFPEPSDDQLAAYKFSAVPPSQRPHPSCGKPGSGRRAHTRRGEPCCKVCRHAEAEYTAWRRAMGLVG